MGTKIVQEGSKDISVFDLESGKLAKIVKWGNCDYYIGLIVQRYGDDIIQINGGYRGSWSGLLSCKEHYDHTLYRVIILQPGTILELT